MTDKEKIRAEIERRLDELNPQKGEFMGRPLRDVNPRTFPRERELEKLLTFIDSLPEEPISKVWHDGSEKPNGKDYVIAWDGKYASIAHYKEVINCKWCYLKDILDKKEEPVSEDLEDAAIKYAATGEFLSNGKEMIDFQKELAFKAGAEWQKSKIKH